MEILIQLKEELGRLYIAGSKNAVNDPRIKKYVEPLEKLGEKSKVFASLKDNIETLVNGTEAHSYSNLTKVYTLLSSILLTQVEMQSRDIDVVELEDKDKVYKNMLSYKEIQICPVAYNNEGFITREQMLEVVHNDYRVYEPLIKSFKDTPKFFNSSKAFDEERTYSKLNDLLLEANDDFLNYVVNTHKFTDTYQSEKLFEYIKNKVTTKHELYESFVLPSALAFSKKKNSSLLKPALEVLGMDIANEEIVLKFAYSDAFAINQSAIFALYTMGSSKFEAVLIASAQKGIHISTFALRKLVASGIEEDKLEHLVDLVIEYYKSSLSSLSKYYHQALMLFLEIVATLSYDKYHWVFEEYLNNPVAYSEEYYMGLDDVIMFNLISNDIRYNALIAESIIKFIKANNESSKPIKLYKSKSLLIYYYLVVIKNLYDKETVYKLTIEFLEFIHKPELLIEYYKNAIRYDFSPVIVALCKNYDICKYSRVERIEKYGSLNNELELSDIDINIFEYLFNNTYYFQSILGLNVVFNQEYELRFVKLFEQYFEIKPTAKQEYLQKTLDFVENHVDCFKENNTTIPIQRYRFTSLLQFNDEDFTRTFFEIVLYICNKYEYPAKFQKEFEFVFRYIKDKDTNVSFKKYKYILEEEKFQVLKEIFK